VPRGAMTILAFVFAATWFVTGAMAAHLPRLLEIAGASTTAAIAAAALVGPAQVTARLVEFGALRMVHPLVSARLAALLHPIGAVILGLLGPGAITAFAVLHGAGNGLLTIAKGTVPLAIFGPVGYALPALLPDYIARWDLSKTEAGLAGRYFLLGLCGDGPGARLLDRPAGGSPRLYAGHRSDGAVAFRVCSVCRWVLVGAVITPACRHRLGRDLHAGPEGDRRPARGNSAIQPERVLGAAALEGTAGGGSRSGIRIISH
jgi:hypothetical protein